MQRRARNLPVVWQWSICAPCRPRRGLATEIGERHTAQDPFWSDHALARDSSVNPHALRRDLRRDFWDSAGSANSARRDVPRLVSRTCSIFSARHLAWASLAHCLHLHANLSGDRRSRPKSSANFLIPHVRHSLPSSVASGSFGRRGCFSRHFCDEMAAIVLIFSGWCRAYRRVAAAAQGRQLAPTLRSVPHLPHLVRWIATAYLVQWKRQ